MVGDRQLLVPGGDGPVLLETVDGSFHDVALAVRRTVEAGAATRRVSAPGNDRADAAPAPAPTPRSAASGESGCTRSATVRTAPADHARALPSAAATPSPRP